MAINTMQYPTGYVDPHCFKEVSNLSYVYESPINYRTYEIHYTDQRWKCNCPDARYRQRRQAGRCKHEKALIELIMQAQTRGRSHLEIIAEEIAEKAQERAVQQSEIAILRAEVAQLRAAMPDFIDIALHEQQIAILRTELAQAHTAIQAATQQPDLAAILEEIAALKAENTEIKHALATKATARRKHQTETEAAQIKEDMNQLFKDVTSTAQTTIQTTAMLKDRLASLEVIPHDLKAELDSWTEAGKPELQPDFQPDDPNSPEIKAQVRAMQRQAYERREATPEERRAMAPLNGNQAFNIYK